MQSFTWRVHRNNGNIVVIFPSQSYPYPDNKPGRRQKKYSVPTFTLIPHEGYHDFYQDIVKSIQDEVRLRFGNLIDEYMSVGGVPNMLGKISKGDWQIRPHYDVYRAAERERWNNPPGEDAPDPIDIEVVDLFEYTKPDHEVGSTKKYAIKGTAHIDLKLEGYTFEIRNLFWGVKHQSYEVRVKSPKKRHPTQDKTPIKQFITLSFRPFTPKGNRDLQLKIEGEMIHEILKLYAEDIEQRKPEFQKAYNAIHKYIKTQRRLAASNKKRNFP